MVRPALPSFLFVGVHFHVQIGVAAKRLAEEQFINGSKMKAVSCRSQAHSGKLKVKSSWEQVEDEEGLGRDRGSEEGLGRDRETGDRDRVRGAPMAFRMKVQKGWKFKVDRSMLQVQSCKFNVDSAASSKLRARCCKFKVAGEKLRVQSWNSMLSAQSSKIKVAGAKFEKFKIAIHSF